MVYKPSTRNSTAKRIQTIQNFFFLLSFIGFKAYVYLHYRGNDAAFGFVMKNMKR